MTAKTAGTTKAKATTTTTTRRPAAPKRLPRAATHGSRIIEALEAAWSEIRKHHPAVPAAVMITGSGNHQKSTPEGFATLGHHWAERWVTDAKTGQRAPELFIAGELLAAANAGRLVLETLLHEAAHAAAHTRGIKDTSASGNRYHNKKFAEIAAELGLRAPDKPAKIIGFSECLITDETAKQYATVTAAIEKARLPYLTATRPAPAPPAPARKGKTARPATRETARSAEASAAPSSARATRPASSRSAPSSLR